MAYKDLPVRELDSWQLNYAVAKYVCKHKTRTALHLPHRFYIEEEAFRPVSRIVDGKVKVELEPFVKCSYFLPVEHKEFSRPVIERLGLKAYETEEGWACKVGDFEPFTDFHADIALLRAAVAHSSGSELVLVPLGRVAK
ncbi:hypothetical protein [Pseudomonas sp. 2995-1]|uniref:hypothetical protein n=1 Tax=Pseudomonas sp. 2995-1 TaxID=1712679 RepID=UPI000C1453F5|nr:hypothetical protein [Pseudomonas sp. 2995-1]PIB57245.1 hypothetical protein AOA61_07735 [Pseudomonas sp. 2995-1]